MMSRKSCTNSRDPELARLTLRRPLQVPSTMYEPQGEYRRFDPSPSSAFSKSTTVWPHCASRTTICPDVLLTAMLRWSGEKAASEGCEKGWARTVFDLSARSQMNTSRASVASSRRHMKRQQRNWRRSSTVSLQPRLQSFKFNCRPGHAMIYRQAFRDSTHSRVCRSLQAKDFKPPTCVFSHLQKSTSSGPDVVARLPFPGVTAYYSELKAKQWTLRTAAPQQSRAVRRQRRQLRAGLCGTYLDALSLLVAGMPDNRAVNDR